MSLCFRRSIGRVAMVLACWALSGVVAKAQPPVTVSAADPSSGEQDTVGLVVKVTGKNFAAGARTDFFRSGTSDPAGITVTSTRHVSATEVEATIDIAAGAALSLFDVRVTNSNGRSGKGSDLFRVVEKGARAACTIEALPANVALVTTLNTLVGGSPAFGPNLGVSAAMASATLTFADSSTRTVLVAAVGTPQSTAKLEIFVLDATTGLSLDGTQLCAGCSPQSHVQLTVPNAGGTGHMSTGDVNADGIPDFAVLERNSTKAAVFVGELLPSGQLVYSAVVLPPGPKYCCSDIAVGDLDGVAGDEIALGNLGGGSGKAAVGGRLHLYRVTGGTATLYQTIVPSVTPAVTSGDLYGSGLSIADVTNDGLPDVVVGAPLRDVGGIIDAGAVFVHAGGQGAFPPYSLAATPRLLVPAAPVAKHAIGSRVGIGDVDASGVSDVVALTLSNPAAKGEVFPGQVVDGQVSDSTWNLTTRPGFVSGWATNRPGVGDINGDGLHDVVVGAPDVGPPAGCAEQGMVYVFLADPTGGWTRLTVQQGPVESDDTQLGYSVAVAHGYPFVLVGDNFRNLGSTTSAGQAFVYRVLP